MLTRILSPARLLALGLVLALLGHGQARASCDDAPGGSARTLRPARLSAGASVPS
ncbi:hypothetical protein [Methylobacterium isbiliense]|jgi:hypothetical protein|uniref:Uncharacterized protein n=1 Tax=Methylobacterium isbiliense TaxID=315478 RepID=A0ABQ4SFW0_9HYPH|nr:hypothetical protein [Methylobacterium isbiliense]MDN3624296.1 hypothetical protein [Methylobacterium isbiliense]GJE01429.1 hypothetical protein GMJLKIPL_3359 [Methylobacterium isbiliense]